MTQNLLVLKLVSVFICLTYFLEHLWLRLLWALECLSRLTSPPSTCNAVEAPGLATNSFFCFLFVKQGHQQVCCARRRQQSLITVNRIEQLVTRTCTFASNCWTTSFSTINRPTTAGDSSLLSLNSSSIRYDRLLLAESVIFHFISLRFLRFPQKPSLSIRNITYPPT